MDNLSQEKNGNINSQEGEDIEFDENINIEDIQKILQQHMAESAVSLDEEEEEKDDEEDEEDSDNNDDPDTIDLSLLTAAEEVAQESEAFAAGTETAGIDPQAKKYVIYIDPENIEFIEKLSISERKLIINQTLRDHDESIIRRKQQEQSRKFLRHSIVAALTVIIGLPLLFILVNKSLEVAISNYQTSEKNFGTLYREKGRIKLINRSSINNN